MSTCGQLTSIEYRVMNSLKKLYLKLQRRLSRLEKMTKKRLNYEAIFKVNLLRQHFGFLFKIM